MEHVFMCMNPKKIVDLIGHAQSRIVFINSGINEEIASALIIKSDTIGKDNITIFTDFSEAVCQYGYGTALGFDHINDGGLSVQKIENLRIGCLLVDNRGWVFSPTPLLLEADKLIDTQPNAIEVTPEQILALLNTAAPDLIKPKEKEYIEDKKAAEPGKLKGEKVTKEDIKTLTTKLEKNPPKKFDVSRKVNVFNTIIEFVELNLEGCSIGRKTVSIPSKLLIGGVDSETQKQLKAGYRVVSSDCDLTGKELNKKVEKIRKAYTRSIQHYGRVALKSKLGNPPMDLTGQIEDDKPDEDQAKMWLDAELTNIFPQASDLMKEMKIQSIFKGVTCEILVMKNFKKRYKEIIVWSMG